MMWPAFAGGKQHGEPANGGKFRLVVILTQFDLAVRRECEPDAHNQYDTHRQHDEPTTASEHHLHQGGGKGRKASRVDDAPHGNDTGQGQGNN